MSRRSAEPVAVIGAGPYGLAAAAHLRAAGVSTIVFGDPMGYWRDQMPKGMLLRSSKGASHLAEPTRDLTLDRWAREAGRTLVDPIPLTDFLDYGAWFAARAVPDVDRRRVERVERTHDGYRLRLADGDELAAGRVVVAAGLFPFGRRPEPFASLPADAVSHAGDHADLSPFDGKDVLVVGGGQSALESSALLHEEGANVEVVARTPAIHWLPPRTARRSLRERGYPPTDVGGRVSGWVAAAPEVFRRWPDDRKPSIAERCLKPAGSDWLRARLADVPITCGRRVVAATHDGRVEVELDDGSTRTVDHVLLGTGYEIDVTRYPFLPGELTAGIARDRGFPLLRTGFESSVAGLHFLGAPATVSFGPIMRFVAGSWHAGPALARYVSGQRQRPLTFAFH